MPVDRGVVNLLLSVANLIMVDVDFTFVLILLIFASKSRHHNSYLKPFSSVLFTTNYRFCYYQTSCGSLS